MICTTSNTSHTSYNGICLTYITVIYRYSGIHRFINQFYIKIIFLKLQFWAHNEKNMYEKLIKCRGFCYMFVSHASMYTKHSKDAKEQHSTRTNDAPQSMTATSSSSSSSSSSNDDNDNGGEIVLSFVTAGRELSQYLNLVHRPYRWCRLLFKIATVIIGSPTTYKKNPGRNKLKNQYQCNSPQHSTSRSICKYWFDPTCWPT